MAKKLSLKVRLGTNEKNKKSEDLTKEKKAMYYSAIQKK